MQELTKVAYNVGCMRKAIVTANATYNDLQPVNGCLSPKGVNAIVVLAAYCLACGEGVPYDVAQEYLDSMQPSDKRYTDIINRTSTLVKKNMTP